MNATRSSMAALAMLAAVLGSSAAMAQDRFPARPVRIVVGFSPGGATDLVARIVAEGLRDRYRESVIVDNKPGGGTDIAVDFTLKSPPEIGRAHV